MNKHQVLFLVTLLTVGACKGPTQLAVRAASGGPEGKIVGRPQLVIRLLPYDRDSIFSVLTGRASRPEPQAPADLVELRDSIAVAQSRWRDAEASWNDSRSELQSISERAPRARSCSSWMRLYPHAAKTQVARSTTYQRDGTALIARPGRRLSA